MDLEKLLDQALAKREPLIRLAQTTALRLFNGRADGLEGLVVEQFADVLIVQTFPGQQAFSGEERLRAAIERLRQRVGARAVYRKIFVPDRAAAGRDVQEMQTSPQPWLGDPVEPEIKVAEHGLQYAIHPYEGFSVGLFLEHRD